MNIDFKYNVEKDIENFMIVAKAKKIEVSSIFLEEKRFLKYKMYFEKYGPILNKDKLKEFINEYVVNNKINVAQKLKIIENEWNQISKIFWPRAEKIFKTKLPNKQMIGYLTIHNICGYSIRDNYFLLH